MTSTVNISLFDSFNKTTNNIQISFKACDIHEEEQEKYAKDQLFKAFIPRHNSYKNIKNNSKVKLINTGNKSSKTNKISKIPKGYKFKPQGIQIKKEMWSYNWLNNKHQVKELTATENCGNLFPNIGYITPGFNVLNKINFNLPESNLAAPEYCNQWNKVCDTPLNMRNEANNIYPHNKDIVIVKKEWKKYNSSTDISKMGNGNTRKNNHFILNKPLILTKHPSVKKIF